MSALAYTNADILVDGYRFQAQFNELSIEHSAEMLDATVFGVGTRVNKGGLFVSRVTGGGLAAFAVNGVEEIMFGDIGTDLAVVAAFPAGCNEGEASGYVMQSTMSTFTMGGAVGVLVPFTMVAEHVGD